MARFVDTNVLLYAVSTARDEVDKKFAALRILDRDDVRLSVQVLQEFYVQATRQTRTDALTHDQALRLVESWLRFDVVDTTVDLVLNASATAARWKISYWDAAVVEAARIGRCDVLLSEDLQHGIDFAGVRVENPFEAV